MSSKNGDHFFEETFLERQYFVLFLSIEPIAYHSLKVLVELV